MTSYRGLAVLFAGDLNPYSNSYSRLKAFERLGARVSSISHTAAGNAETGYATPSIAFRLAWKLGIQLDTENAGRRLLRDAPGFSPDLIWIEKGNMIRPGVLRQLRALCPGAVLASYSDDDMYRRANRSRAYKRCLGEYDIVFTTKSYNAAPRELPRLGARRVVMVDKAYDPDQHFPVTLTPEEEAWLGADVGFIGSYEADRAAAMLHLAGSGVRVRVWGNGWDSFRGDGPNLAVERRALVNTADDPLYSKGICATRINLAFLRKANRDLHTDRSIEIPACGGFMLAEHSDEHVRLFEDGREAVFFRSPDELVETVRYYLRHADERRAIAAAGRRRCVESGYRHEDRVAFMLDAIFGGGNNAVASKRKRSKPGREE